MFFVIPTRERSETGGIPSRTPTAERGPKSLSFRAKVRRLFTAKLMGETLKL